MKKSIFSLASFSLLVLVILGACKKNELPDLRSENEQIAATSSAIDQNTMVVISDADWFGMLDGFVGTEASNGNEMSNENGCPTITVDPADRTTFPKTMTIDFGDGCSRTGSDIIKKGKMIIVFTGRPRVPGTVATTTFDNYFINDRKMEGTITKTYGQNGFNITVRDGKLSDADGSISFQSTKTIVQIAGQNTRMPQDDVFRMTGRKVVSNSNGGGFTANTTKPVIKKFICPFVVEGTIEIKNRRDDLIVIDYGDGRCDNEYTVTVNGETETKFFKPGRR